MSARFLPLLHAARTPSSAEHQVQKNKRHLDSCKFCQSTPVHSRVPHAPCTRIFTRISANSETACTAKRYMCIPHPPGSTLFRLNAFCATKPPALSPNFPETTPCTAASLTTASVSHFDIPNAHFQQQSHTLAINSTLWCQSTHFTSVLLTFGFDMHDPHKQFSFAVSCPPHPPPRTAKGKERERETAHVAQVLGSSWVAPSWRYDRPNADPKVKGVSSTRTSSTVALTLPVIEIQLLFVQVVEDGDTYVGKLGTSKAQKAKDLPALYGMLGFVDFE